MMKIRLFRVFLLALTVVGKVVVSVSVSGETTANSPHDEVQTLTGANFQDAVFGDPANGFWFLKFFAPWCGHCKRMAPVLRELAPLLKGKMAIGAIDCTVEKKLCDKYGVKGYPTLKFARDGEIYDYPGGRNPEDIVDFAKKMSKSPITTVDSYDDAIAKALDSEEGIAFVVHHPQVTGNTIEEQLQSTTMTQVAAQVSRKRQATSNFYLYTGDDIKPFLGVEEARSSRPFVSKVEDHAAPLVWSPEKEEDVHSPALLKWLDANNFPLVTELGPHNFNKMGKAGRRLAMGIVDGEDEAMIATIKTDLAAYAANGPKAIVDQYYFGWLDGKKWGKFITQFDVEAGALPQILVLHVPSREYWQNTDYKTVQSFLEAIDNGEIKVQDHASHRGFVGKMHKLEYWFFRHMPWSLIGLIVFAILMVVFVVPAADELRPPYPRQDVQAAQAQEEREKEESKKEK